MGNIYNRMATMGLHIMDKLKQRVEECYIRTQEILTEPQQVVFNSWDIVTQLICTYEQIVRVERILSKLIKDEIKYG